MPRLFEGVEGAGGGQSMIRILIADDHVIVRAGLREFIADQPDMEVVFEASSGTEAIAAVRAQHFDVVLLDISMPSKNGIDTLRSLKQLRPDVPILILSAYSEEQYAMNLLQAGAAGYINKEAASTQLVGAIRTVVQGRKYVSGALAQILANSLTSDAEKAPHVRLSQREFQIFCKLAEGLPVSKIADELNLSVKTVSTYRTRVMEKTAMRSNAEITRYAIKSGLIR
jgi:DNA-binding NarL/FixJ family response regulator